jgi:hypothetical protein
LESFGLFALYQKWPKVRGGEDSKISFYGWVVFLSIFWIAGAIGLIEAFFGPFDPYDDTPRERLIQQVKEEEEEKFAAKKARQAVSRRAAKQAGGAADSKVKTA